ncbi:acyltransferase family protein [Paenarthrobacter nicotinovorans]|uniref:acyltransferase family protein n=1 Tax=Paenarthrobacter nicotinovorans TaxID=29320 RepID=UPI003A7FFE9F
MATSLSAIGLRTAGSASSRKAGFRPDIQGLRALAVTGVVLYHAGVSWLPGGFVGVDVFFVISGFLITGLLCRGLETTGRIRLASFYARRIRRLLPASALVLAVSLVAAKLFVPPLLLSNASKDAIATAAYLPNMWFAFTGTDYLSGSEPSIFQHYWSLALEEQFYLVWPVLMTLIAGAAIGRGRRVSRRRRLVFLLLPLTVASFVGCVVLTQLNQPWAFFSLPTRAWELGAGALLALSGASVRRLPGVAHRTMVWVGLATIVGAMVFMNESVAFPGWTASIPVLGTVLAIAGGCGEGDAVRVLGNPLAQYVGNISYSLYLWHWPALIMPPLIMGTQSPGWASAAGVAIAVLLAHFTFKFVESGFKRAEDSRSSNRRSYVLWAALTVVTVAGGFGIGRLPALDSGQPVRASSSSELSVPIEISDSVPSNVEPRLIESRDSLPLVYSDGCHVDFPGTSSPECTYGNRQATESIVLFGDSHAAQWFTPLKQIAAESNRMLVSLTKSSCPSVSIAVANKTSRNYTQCDQWRVASIERIKKLKPSVVVISNYSAAYRSLGHSGARGFASDWQSGLEETLSQMPSETAVLLIGDGPSWPASPNICLSAHLKDAAHCALPATSLVDKEIHALERSAIRPAQGMFVAATDWLCDTQCSPLAGNVLAYRDENHLTNEMAGLLSGKISDSIDTVKALHK